jgi:hypothetical protein
VVSAADAAELRQALIGVRALVDRDLTAFFGSLNLDRPESARDQLLEFVPLLVAQYGEVAASFAADWYDEMRDAEGIPGRFRAAEQTSPYEDATEGLVRRAAGDLFTDNPAGALLTLTTSAGKYALAAGRETVARATDRDPQASGWQRVTRSGSCRFCTMLAQRGAVYKESSAFFASHGDCNCAAVPSWDPNAPEVDTFAYEASVRMSDLRRAAERGEPGAQRRLDEHNALIRRAVEEYA